MEIDPKDLKIEIIGNEECNENLENTQGVKITHLPTGIIAESHKERGQIKNKNKCLELLNEKLSK